MINAHTFESTGDAYDMTMCRDDIATGDTLVIADENVVGIAWAWPLAVTVDAGNLHGVNNAINLLAEEEHKTYMALTRGAEAAIAKAREMGLPIADAWVEWENAE